MPEYICNTSPLQYLHQLKSLPLLAALFGQVTVPTAVVSELGAGRSAGYDVPEPCDFPWMIVRTPASSPALPLAADLGLGEASVLALALETRDCVAILDDGVARRAACLLGIRLTGTLGVLVDAKRRALIPAVAPLLDRLNSLNFRVSPATRAAVLALVGE